jgi:uncharacterized protein (DUF3084 family)
MLVTHDAQVQSLMGQIKALQTELSRSTSTERGLREETERQQRQVKLLNEREAAGTRERELEVANQVCSFYELVIWTIDSLRDAC